MSKKNKIIINKSIPNNNPNNLKDLQSVQNQYQNLPYPYRNPEDEKTRLLSVIAEHLSILNHFLYKGKQDFKSNFRVLIAGGGTGDSCIFMAEQLKNTNAEVVYLDFSKTSMEIAQKRAEIRGLKNIKWFCDSIFNIPSLNLGKFDFINCSGVLHHLHSPDEGLKILSDSLNENGGMNLMVYGKYGRTGLYHIQEIIKMINKGINNIPEEVNNAKKILSNLPATNWFVRAKELLTDHIAYGDIGLYDMFLHKQDRAYSVPEIYEFANKAGLNFVNFSTVNDRLKLKPESYIQDPELLTKIQGFDTITKQAICEILVGDIIKHEFWVSKIKDSVASFLDLDNIPIFDFNTSNIPLEFYQHLDKNNIIPGTVINFTVECPNLISKANMNLMISDCTKIIFKSITERKTIGEMVDILKQEFDATDEQLLTDIKNTLEPFTEAGVLILKNKNIK